MVNNKTSVGRFATGVVALITSVIAVSWLLGNVELSWIARLGLATIPVIAWVFTLVSYSRLIQNLDELQRRVHLDALAFAFTGLAVALLACEYLRKARILTAFKPDYVLMLMLVLWLVGFAIARRRYQ